MVKELRLRCQDTPGDYTKIVEACHPGRVFMEVFEKPSMSSVYLSKNQVRLLRNWCNSWLREQR